MHAVKLYRIRDAPTIRWDWLCFFDPLN